MGGGFDGGAYLLKKKVREGALTKHPRAKKFHSATGWKRKNVAATGGGGFVAYGETQNVLDSEKGRPQHRSFSKQDRRHVKRKRAKGGPGLVRKLKGKKGVWEVHYGNGRPAPKAVFTWGTLDPERGGGRGRAGTSE